MDEATPPVTFLYTKKTLLPDVAFRVSAIPLALASRLKYGRPAFRAAGITSKEVQSAFASTSTLVIGTHGSEDGFAVDDGGLIGPDGSHHPQMKTLFFGSCNVGRRLPDWQNEFPNAKIVSYSREMMQIEGWIYLVFGSWKDLLNRPD